MKHSLTDRRGLSSLDVAADCQEWWRYWGPRIAEREGRQGWILFLLDANEKLQEVGMLVSRLLRNKPEWDSRGWAQAEWLNVEDQGAAALAWFERHAPAAMRDAPEWAHFLFTAQHGNFMVLKRDCRELRAVQEQGYMTAVLEQRGDQIVGVGEETAHIATREVA